MYLHVQCTTCTCTLYLTIGLLSPLPLHTESMDELTLKAGDLIMLKTRVGSDWLRGKTIGGTEGIFPKSYVEVVVSCFIVRVSKSLLCGLPWSSILVYLHGQHSWALCVLLLYNIIVSYPLYVHVDRYKCRLMHGGYIYINCWAPPDPIF